MQKYCANFKDNRISILKIAIKHGINRGKRTTVHIIVIIQFDLSKKRQQNEKIMSFEQLKSKSKYLIPLNINSFKA